MEPKNLPEFKALIERYETITIEEIEKENCDPERLTGFGYGFCCTLCISATKLMDKEGSYIDQKCNYCVYSLITSRMINKYPCVMRPNRGTYNAIDKAKTANQLLKAYWLRAKHMRSILKKLNLE